MPGCKTNIIWNEFTKPFKTHQLYYNQRFCEAKI